MNLQTSTVLKKAPLYPLLLHPPSIVLTALLTFDLKRLMRATNKRITALDAVVTKDNCFLTPKVELIILVPIFTPRIGTAALISRLEGEPFLVVEETADSEDERSVFVGVEQGLKASPCCNRRNPTITKPTIILNERLPTTHGLALIFSRLPQRSNSPVVGYSVVE